MTQTSQAASAAWFFDKRDQIQPDGWEQRTSQPAIFKMVVSNLGGGKLIIKNNDKSWTLHDLTDNICSYCCLESSFCENHKLCVYMYCMCTEDNQRHKSEF